MSLRTALTGFAGDALLPEVRPGRGQGGQVSQARATLSMAADARGETPLLMT
jgi:hypothetical protein